MTKSQKTEPTEIELRPDGWERFVKAVDAAARTPARQGQSVRLTLDASEFLAALADLSAEPAQLPAEIVQGAIGLCDFPAELARIDIDALTATAGELTVRLKPSDGLIGLVAALRARNADRLIVECTGHGRPSGAGAMTP